MKTEQKHWTKENGWTILNTLDSPESPQLVFVFGDRRQIESADHLVEIKSWYPQANFLFCSSAGEIIDTSVHDETVSVTAVQFDTTGLAFGEVKINDVSESMAGGQKLAELLPRENLTHVLVFSDGLRVNGVALISGLLKGLPKDTTITGGLVGDGVNFEKTVLGLNSIPSSGKVAVIGFYGNSLRVGHGSLSGCSSFGPKRLITRSKGNILYELDNEPVLSLYKRYLGNEAKSLPSSGRLFPVNLIEKDGNAKKEAIRTLIAINDDEQSMTFLGDMPFGAHVTLTRTSPNRLIDSARRAARMSGKCLGSLDSELAILVSCIGRKLVLKGRAEEEIEVVRKVLGPKAAIAGFYSYGEISPTSRKVKQCKLDNQTMTITTFKEN